MIRLTVPDCAEVLGVSRQRVWRLVRRGKLRAERAGRDWIITKRDLLRLVEDRAERGIMPPDPDAE